MTKRFLCFSFFLNAMSVASQSNYSIYGNVYEFDTKNTPIDSAYIYHYRVDDLLHEITGDSSPYSNNKGAYRFKVDKIKGYDSIEVNARKTSFLQFIEKIKVEDRYLHIRMKKIDEEKIRQQNVISQTSSKGENLIDLKKIEIVNRADSMSNRDRKKIAISVNETELIDEKLMVAQNIINNSGMGLIMQQGLFSYAEIEKKINAAEKNLIPYNAYDLYVWGLNARIIDEYKLAEQIFEKSLLSDELNKFVESDINIALKEVKIKLARTHNIEHSNSIRTKMSNLENDSINYIFHSPYWQILMGKIKSENKELPIVSQSVIERKNDAIRNYFETADRDLDMIYARQNINKNRYLRQYILYHKLKHLAGIEMANAYHQIWKHEKLLFKYGVKQKCIKQNRISYRHLKKAYPDTSSYVALLSTRHAELYRMLGKYRKSKKFYHISNKIINHIYDDGLSIDKIPNYIGLGFVNLEQGNKYEAFKNMKNAEILAGVFYEEFDPTIPEIYYWRAISYQSELKNNIDPNDSIIYHKAMDNYNYAINAMDHCIRKAKDLGYKENLEKIRIKIILAKANFLKINFTFFLMGQKVVDSLTYIGKIDQVKEFKKSFKNGKSAINWDKTWKKNEEFSTTSLFTSYYSNIEEILNLLTPILNDSITKSIIESNNVLQSEIIIQYLWAACFLDWLKYKKLKRVNNAILDNIVISDKESAELIMLKKRISDIVSNPKMRDKFIMSRVNNFFIPNNKLPVNVIGDFEY